MLPCDSSALPSLKNFLASPVAATSTSVTSITSSAIEGGVKATKLLHPAISIALRLETPFCGATADANESERIKKDAHIRLQFDLVMASMVYKEATATVQYDARRNPQVPCRKKIGFWEDEKHRQSSVNGTKYYVTRGYRICAD
jgi:hypothetical protein